MAHHKTLSSLGAALQKRAFVIEKVATKHVRTVANIVDASAVNATPVDLGRARSSWGASIGAPFEFDTKVEEEIGREAATSIALSQAKSVIDTWKLGRGSIFISNGVFYILPLDRGHSAQAPEGMTTQAIAAAKNYLASAKLLEGS